MSYRKLKFNLKKNICEIRGEKPRTFYPRSYETLNCCINGVTFVEIYKRISFEYKYKYTLVSEVRIAYSESPQEVLNSDLGSIMLNFNLPHFVDCTVRGPILRILYDENYPIDSVGFEFRGSIEAGVLVEIISPKIDESTYKIREPKVYNLVFIDQPEPEYDFQLFDEKYDDQELEDDEWEDIDGYSLDEPIDLEFKSAWHKKTTRISKEVLKLNNFKELNKIYSSKDYEKPQTPLIYNPKEFCMFSHQGFNLKNNLINSGPHFAQIFEQLIPLNDQKALLTKHYRVWQSRIPNLKSNRKLDLFYQTHPLNDDLDEDLSNYINKEISQPGFKSSYFSSVRN